MPRHTTQSIPVQRHVVRLSKIDNWHYTHRKIRKINKKNNNDKKKKKKEANGEHHMQPVAFPFPFALERRTKKQFMKNKKKRTEKEKRR